MCLEASRPSSRRCVRASRGPTGTRRLASPGGARPSTASAPLSAAARRPGQGARPSSRRRQRARQGPRPQRRARPRQVMRIPSAQGRLEAACPWETLQGSRLFLLCLEPTPAPPVTSSRSPRRAWGERVQVARVVDEQGGALNWLNRGPPQEHVPACARQVEVMARLERSARSTRQVELRGRRSLAGRSSQFASPWPASLWCRGARW